MKVSIILITYNQSGFIEQSLDSIAMQMGDMELEIIVADDCSADNTFDLIQSYPLPARFKFILLPRHSNLGFVKNYQRAFAACTGDYIAVMEGDDYWTDPRRLKKHVDFLAKHPLCVLTMNRYMMRNEFSNRYIVEEWASTAAFEFVTGAEMAFENRLGNMSACVFRKSETEKLKPDLFDLPVADWMFGMVLCEYGNIAILNEVMSVYRIHKSGQWSRLNVQEQLKKMNELIDQYDQYLEYEYHHEFSLHKKRINKVEENVIHPRKNLPGQANIFGRIKNKIYKFTL